MNLGFLCDNFMELNEPSLLNALNPEKWLALVKKTEM
jgi:hypothetical protein